MEKQFVVIELKSKEEKVKVLTFLASETEAEYKVTSDLKKFVSEKYNISITDNNWFVPTPFEIEAPSSETVSQSSGIAENIPPYPDYTTTSNISVQPSTTVENQFPSVDYGVKQDEEDVFAAYREPVRTPQHDENVDQVNEVDNRISFLDPNYYELDDDDMESTTTVESTPSTSNATKRRATEESAMPAPKRQAIRKNNESTEEKCKKCSSIAQFDSYNEKYRHATVHLGIKRFGCFVEKCGFRNGTRDVMVRHMKKYHPTQLTCFGLVTISKEENEQLEAIMRECFPMPDTNDNEGYCRVCHHFIGGEGDAAESNKRRHAQNHMHFMLYKCSKPGCLFEGKSKIAMQTHQRMHTDLKNPKVSSLSLTDDQRKEIENIFIKCFPEYQTNREIFEEIFEDLKT